MRISDDRYSRDRLRLDLALRFIRHDARTQTIRRWTGLSEDRVRKLFRSYSDCPEAGPSPRPRGRSPRQSSFFTRTPRLRQEAALIASLCSLLGALPLRREPRGGGPQHGFAEGLALCEAYEAYRAFVPTAHISFEHMVCLFTALSRGDELRLATCAGCGALVITERMALKDARCLSCAEPAEKSAARTGDAKGCRNADNA
ncbi:MAG: hypothetical protein ACRETB_13000 [Steroidobacteraceae bacterium]